MEHISIFLCDIIGTYKVDYKMVDINELEKFLINLDSLRKQNNSSKLLFSFVSTENEEIVRNESYLLKNINKNDGIVIGKQFFECGYIYQEKAFYKDAVGKVFQIKDYIKELSDEYIIDKIYFADDNSFYHYIINELLLDLFDIQSILPTKLTGLKELNEIISSLINDNKIKRIK